MISLRIKSSSMSTYLNMIYMMKTGFNRENSTFLTNARNVWNVINVHWCNAAVSNWVIYSLYSFYPFFLFLYFTNKCFGLKFQFSTSCYELQTNLYLSVRPATSDIATNTSTHHSHELYWLYWHVQPSSLMQMQSKHEVKQRQAWPIKAVSSKCFKQTTITNHSQSSAACNYSAKRLPFTA